MPVFNSSTDCPKQIKRWLLISIVVTMVFIYLTGFAFGLLGATMAMLASFVGVWYLLDHYGDYLFKDTKSAPTEDEINSYKKRPFPYHN